MYKSWSSEERFWLIPRIALSTSISMIEVLRKPSEQLWRMSIFCFSTTARYLTAEKHPLGPGTGLKQRTWHRTTCSIFRWKSGFCTSYRHSISYIPVSSQNCFCFICFTLTFVFLLFLVGVFVALLYPVRYLHFSLGWIRTDNDGVYDVVGYILI